MNKPTLLLVDDEERILRSLRMLFFAGYTVHTATDPEEAMRILREQRVHVIVSDQRMPMMQGAELLRRAREISPATMRILLTGYSDLEASIASVNEGEVFRYLTKPWSSDEVKQVVAEAAAIAQASFAAQHAPGKTAAATFERPRVLVMDDDEVTIGAVSEVLQDRCDIIHATDVEQAQEALARQDVALVVSELILGGAPVAYILKTLKKASPQTQCMVVTRFNDTAQLATLINQAQILRYLPKPVNLGILANNLESLLDRFHLLASMPVLQQRQAVAPISDPGEKQLSGGFAGLLERLRKAGAPLQKSAA